MVDGESRPSSCACGGTLAQHRLALLSSWRDPQAQEPLLHRRDTPILPLRRERLRRNVEQVSPWFGVREPAHVRDRSNHAHLEGDRMVLSTLVLKDRKKPEQCWLPHGMPSDDRAFAWASRVFPTASQIKAPYKLRHYQCRIRHCNVLSGPLAVAQAHPTTKPYWFSTRHRLPPTIQRWLDRPLRPICWGLRPSRMGWINSIP